MKFLFSDELIVDSEVEPWRSEGIRIGFFSAPGTRKSYTVAACIVEPFLEEGGTVVIFEPRSEWHTLKQRYESVVVVGGPFQDIALAVNHAKVYAESIVKNGTSMVFDFSETEERDLVRFAAELLARLYTLQNVVRRPLLLFFEELAEYSPFKSTGKLVEPWIYDRMTSRVVKIATQGRPLGFLLVGTSQRPAQLNFTVRMMCNLSFYGKFHPKDLTDIEEVLSAYKDMPAKTLAKECVNMPHGNWIVITGWKPKMISITTRRLTPHGADTPRLEYVAPRREETKKAVSDLTKTIIEALEKERLEESKIEKLKSEVQRLEIELANKSLEVDRLKQTAETLGKIKIEPAKVEGVSVAEFEEVKAERDKLIQDMRTVVLDIKNQILQVFDEYLGAPPPKEPSRKISFSLYETWEPKLPSLCAKRIYKFLLDNIGAKYTKAQLGVALGYKTSGGTFNGAISFLKQNNLVNYDGKFIWCE